MKNRTQTIRKIMTYINNSAEDGGFWLPNIQRPFVWSEEQICRLFDSILRNYPINTLLVWKTNKEFRRRKFIDNWKSDLRLRDFLVLEDHKKKCLVLDGQQRLQSLFIGLRGSYEGKELFLNMFSGDFSVSNDSKYQFEFRNTEEVQIADDCHWMNFKNLISTRKKKWEILKTIESSRTGRALTETETKRIYDNLELIDQTFKMDEALTYQELDSIDDPDLYTEDDVVEIFIRANSGGTQLTKSDLLFSLLSSNWATANDKIEELIEKLNRHGEFKFHRDFVLKTCLVLLEEGSKYEVNKFRKKEILENIESNWVKITNSITEVFDFVRTQTFIQNNKSLPSYLVLIPLIYACYKYPASWRKSRDSKDAENYLLRVLLSGVFSGHADQILDGFIKSINTYKGIKVEDLFSVVRSQNKTLELREEKFWKIGYKSNLIYLLFNIWYSDFLHTPTYQNNTPQIDHIFPQSFLRKIKETDTETGQNVRKYRDSERNQLANLMLLTREENGAGGKGGILPLEWFKNKDKEYLEKHLIPDNPALWAEDRFDDFILERKKLITEKLGHLFVKLTEEDSSFNFSNEASEADIESSLEELIAQDEGDELEFKSTLRWCLRENRADKKLEVVIMKSIAAFSNGYGGTLLIGVNDSGEVIGLENDFSILGNSKDGFELHLRELIKKNFKETFATNNIKITFCAIENSEVCVLQIKRAFEPIYIDVQDKAGNNTKKLYVRSGNSSIEIPIEEVSKFLSSRFTMK